MNETWKADFEARLRSVEWANLTHAYGAATDVPDLLLQLLDERTFGRAIYELQGNLYHQGTRYEATSVAIPFLVELLEKSRYERAQVIQYLLLIAVADTEWHYPQGYRPELGVGAYMTREFADELYTRVQSLAFPIFLRLAQSDEGDEAARRMALWALGWFPERESESRPVLEGNSAPAARFALRMLEATKTPFHERSDEATDEDADEYEELMSEIYG